MRVARQTASNRRHHVDDGAVMLGHPAVVDLAHEDESAREVGAHHGIQSGGHESRARICGGLRATQGYVKQFRTFKVTGSRATYDEQAAVR